MPDRPLTRDERSRLLALAGEYVDLVQRMRGGAFESDQERQVLSSERTLVHDDLLALTGRTRADTDMYAYCRALLAGHQPAPPFPGAGRGRGHA